MEKQIFAYTLPHCVTGETYVRFIQAFENADGTISVTVRDGESRITSIKLSPEQATELAVALSTAALPHLKSDRK